MADTYNPANHGLDFAGIEVTRRKGADKFLSIKWLSSGVTLTLGVNGNGVFNENNDESAEVSAMVPFTSSDNRLLTAAYYANKLAGGGGLPLRIFNVKDKTAQWAAGAAKIKKLPDFELGKSVGEVEWVFVCENLKGTF